MSHIIFECRKCGLYKDIRELDMNTQTCGDDKECLVSYGYAKGNYMNECIVCGKMIEDVDKRCYICMDCALERMHKQQ